MGRTIDELSDLEVVALTVWAEARGESGEGRAAVAWVIKNRASHPGWWGRDARSVCLRRGQFSSWNPPGEPDSQRDTMLALDPVDPILTAIRALVRDVLDGTTPDPTAGATYYFNPSLVRPPWAAKFTKTAEIGRHDFYAAAA